MNNNNTAKTFIDYTDALRGLGGGKSPSGHACAMMPDMSWVRHTGRIQSTMYLAVPDVGVAITVAVG